MLDEIISALRRRESEQNKMLFDPRPAFKKYSMLKKLGNKEYKKVVNSFLQPLPIKLNEEKFSNLIDTYKNNFIPWKNLEKNEVHYNQFAVPIINKTGILHDDQDISLRYLEDVNTIVTDEIVLENDFLLPTEILSHLFFDDLKQFQPYMLRSFITRWFPGAAVLPRFDMILPTTFFQLWAVDRPTNLIFSYENNFDLIEIKDIEPFKLYLLDTNQIHTKQCINDVVHQISISLSINAVNLVQEVQGNEI